jgi:YHS domain-containing protein
MGFLMRLFYLLVMLVFSHSALAACDVNSTNSGVAIGGFDPVSFHVDAKPSKGTKKYQTFQQGVTWFFKNKENLLAFMKHPEKYKPAYGGFCAYSVSVGSKYSGDPTLWSIQGGKLYLQHNRGTQMIWSKDISKHIATADQNWNVMEDACTK